MATEKLNSPENLIGKSVIDIISLLPTFDWYVDPGGMRIEIKPSYLSVIDYDTWKPRQEADICAKIPIEPGSPIPQEKVISYLTPTPGRTTGLMSVVEIEEWQRDLPYYIDKPWVHLPLLDIDLEGELTPDMLGHIQKEIREKTEIDKGILLVSGEKNHCHFIGLERVLTDDQLVTFIGLSLTMVDQRRRMLVDPKWAGYQLTPMSYHKEIAPQVKWSAYDFGLRFATLRIMTSELKGQLPIVRAVL